MKQCPQCQASENQVKVGFTAAGSQRYQCNLCKKKYTPKPKVKGYDETVRRQTVKLHMDGNNQRRTARQMGVSQGSVSNWHRDYVAELTEAAEKPAELVAVGELDELFTYVGEKKTKSTL
jgi:transposase-like protein